MNVENSGLKSEIPDCSRNFRVGNSRKLVTVRNSELKVRFRINVENGGLKVGNSELQSKI